MIYKKYYLYKEQVSLDNGVTWEDVTPAVTAPSGDPIASYSTLEECEGITSCTCADFTYSPTAFTVSSAATSVTFSYTGCTKPDLTSAATYNWIEIGNHTYDTGSTTGSVIANVSANTSSSRTATLNLSLSGTTCQSLTISQESGEAPTACTCDAFAFEGTSEGNNVYRIDVPSGETAVTAASWNTDCGIVPQDFTHTDDSGFQEIVTDGHWAFTDNIIRFTASTNPTSSVRQGYMTITYTVDGVSCEKRTHLVQAAGTGSTPSYDFKLAIDVPAGKTSPVIQFYTADGTYMGGYGRVSTDSEVEITWQGSGTVTKMTFAENGSYLSAVTVHGIAGVTLINNQPLNSGSVTTIDLTQSFNTSDYSGNNRTIYVSFSE